MKTLFGAGSLVLVATLMGATLGAEEETSKGAARAPCGACMDVCRPPLSYDDSLLDESTDRYLPAAARAVATAAAIDMASKLKDIYREYRAGHFGPVYATYAEAIETLVKKQPQDDAASVEVDALKRVRTALYADTVVALQTGAMGAPSRKFAVAYKARAAVLEGVIKSMEARQQMRAAERLAVCEVLAASKDE